MKKVMMIVLIILAVLIVIAAACFGGNCYKNLHWYDRYEKALKSVNAVEKQFTLPSGRVINYGEVENDKPPLLLIHGQMSIWQDYALVMPELSKKWHIYAVDVYGHGGSSHDESLYYLDVNGDDIITFINEVIGEIQTERCRRLTLRHTAVKILPELCWRIRLFSPLRARAGRTALLILTPTSLSMTMTCRTSRSAGKHIICGTATGGSFI